MSGPRLVVICGSTRFQDAIRAAGRAEALAGAVVLGPWSFEPDPAPEVMARLVAAHARMIESADEVLVVAPGGYVGEHTRREIDLARGIGKPIRYWS